MIDFFQKYGGNVHSQNGEDGVISQCVKRLGLPSGLAVEFGANDGLWLSNTTSLLEKGWTGVFIEGDPALYARCLSNWKHNRFVTCHQAYVTPDNINTFVQSNCDLLSIDCDGPDIELLRALKAKPKIIIIEIDSSIPPDRDECNSAGGAGYLPMLKLAISKGYFLLCHTGNLVLIANEYRDLFPEIIGDGISNSELYFNRSWVGQ